MPKEYFKKLQDLLVTEREADLQSYLDLTSNTAASERRALGLTWYPIAIRGKEIGRGDYLTVEIERTNHTEDTHQFRFGASVALFSNHQAREDRLEGILTHVSGNRLKIHFQTDELPEWSRNGKLGVDLLFDNNSYDEMQHALRKATQMDENKALQALIRILINQEKPSFSTETFNGELKNLNEAQQLAVNKIVSAQQLAIVHGPPGTGKTTTLVQAIKAMAARQPEKILVVAPSNTAVDLLTEKLSASGLNVVRVGNPARVSEQLQAATLDHKMAAHPEMKVVKNLKKQADAYRNMAHKYKRSFGHAERAQRKALFDEAHKLIKEVERSEQYIMDHVFAGAQIVTATLVGSNHHTVRHLKYDTIVIDEAGQALEPACWIPILKANKVVLAGDHLQLSPTIKSSRAAKEGLGNTLFEKMVTAHPESVVLLNEQYRMHQSIMGYSSAVFYQDKLVAHHSVADALLFKMDVPLNFIDTAGCSYDEKQQGTNISNPDEAVFLLKHLQLLLEQNSTQNGLNKMPGIAVISPYKEQVQLLRALLADNPFFEPYSKNISVNTIDAFQGQEREVVYISLTRSNPEGTIGFLADTRRMNVAMTRARKKLVVIGDGATLSKAAFYANFISYASDLNGYHSAWEFMDY